MRRFLKWILFGVLCLLSWICALFFLFITGWASCSVAGSCVTDRIVIAGIILLIPTQVAIAVYLRQTEKDAERR